MSLLRRQLTLALPLAALASAVVRPAHALDAPTGPVVLTVRGAVAQANRERQADFDIAMLLRLAQHDIHTETPWFSAARTFSGPLLRDVLAAVGGQGRSVKLAALNDYRVDVPADDPQRYDVIVAHRLDGKPMTVREKVPLFVMYPFPAQPQLRTALYYSRCIWQLRAIDLS